MPYYAVRVGIYPGIYETWQDAKEQVIGVSGAQHRKFDTFNEAKQYLYGNEPKRQQSKPAAAPQQQQRAPAQHNMRKVYTDGCAIGNGQTGSYGGIGVYYGPNDPRNISAPLAGTTQTNNRAELTAIVHALEHAMHNSYTVEVITDSVYSINCLTKWYKTWEQNGYKSQGRPVKNTDLIKVALSMINILNNGNAGNGVKFTHCRGHQGITGNEMADKLANQGAAQGRRILGL